MAAGVAVFVDVAVAVGVEVLVGEAVGVGLGVSVAVSVRLGVTVGVSVGLGVCCGMYRLDLGVSVAVSVALAVTVDVSVGLGVFVAVLVSVTVAVSCRCRRISRRRCWTCRRRLLIHHLLLQGRLQDLRLFLRANVTAIAFRSRRSRLIQFRTMRTRQPVSIAALPSSSGW